MQVAAAIYEENADLSFYSLTKSPSLVVSHIVLASYLTDKPVRISYDKVWNFKSMSKSNHSYSKVIYGDDGNW
jgi:hypothetical protein